MMSHTSLLNEQTSPHTHTHTYTKTIRSAVAFMPAWEEGRVMPAWVEGRRSAVAVLPMSTHTSAGLLLGVHCGHTPHLGWPAAYKARVSTKASGGSSLL